MIAFEAKLALQLSEAMEATYHSFHSEEEATAAARTAVDVCGTAAKGGVHVPSALYVWRRGDRFLVRPHYVEGELREVVGAV